jgi:hypothetical protein
MPDPEQVITTQTCRMLAHKTHRKCLTTGGGTGQPRREEHKGQEGETQDVIEGVMKKETEGRSIHPVEARGDAGAILA